MSILDDAIREHLELKRAHGADATELKKLEDEAFGPPARPDELDALAEAPTEFMAADATEAPDGEGESSGRRLANIADLQEAPSPPSEAPEDSKEEPEVPPDPGHSTEERQAIAEQPTEMFDVEGAPEPPAEASSPSDEELGEVETPAPEIEIADEPVAEEVEEDDFFSEQRLSDELSQALDAPLPEEEHEVPQTDEHAVPHTEQPEDDEEDGDYEDEEYEDEAEEPGAESERHHEDVLEDTPEFLKDAPEDDNLWFEQRPPKDFDFDD